MAAAKLGEEITVGATGIEYIITETVLSLKKPHQEFNIIITGGNSGTIKFAVGETPPAAQKAFAVGAADITFTIRGVENGVRNIWALGSAAGQKFTIT